MASCCCSGGKSGVSALEAVNYVPVSDINTLAFAASLCINCGMCVSVCPHSVFAEGEKIVEIIRPHACMECGACMVNCPVNALFVNSGVGCAAAMISSALTGRSEASCGGPEPENRCC